MRRLAIAAFLSTGCATAAAARTAEIAPENRVALSALATVTWSPGRFEPRDGRSGETTRWNSGPLGGPDLWWLAPLATQVSILVGVGPCELGGIVGAVHIGPEVRCAIADEDEGAAFSMAASVAASYLPWNGPWLRFGLDGSRRFDDVTPIASAYLTWGRVDHATPSGNFFDSLYRDELRLTGVFGAAISANGSGDAWVPSAVLAIAPYRALVAGEAVECGLLQPCAPPEGRLVEPFGIDFLAGGSLAPPPDL